MSGADPSSIPVRLSRDTPARACVDAELFALQVTDASMEPELPRGCVVVIDPGEAAAEGDMVVAELAAGKGISIGRLRCEDAKAWLLVDHPARELPVQGGAAGVMGVVVQRVSGRRATHKRYR